MLGISRARAGVRAACSISTWSADVYIFDTLTHALARKAARVRIAVVGGQHRPVARRSGSRDRILVAASDRPERCQTRLRSVHRGDASRARAHSKRSRPQPTNSRLTGRWLASRSSGGRQSPPSLKRRRAIESDPERKARTSEASEPRERSERGEAASERACSYCLQSQGRARRPGLRAAPGLMRGPCSAGPPCPSTGFGI